MRATACVDNYVEHLTFADYTHKVTTKVIKGGSICHFSPKCISYTPYGRCK